MKPRCEGFRRYGGAFSMGPVRWEQCHDAATVMLEVKQGDNTQILPACQVCWEEARDTKGIIVIDARPIIAKK